MKLPFIERPPTKLEIEKLRLILSTYQDGSGMLEKGILPGWRDFERAVEAAFHGHANENKHIYDVLLLAPDTLHQFYGIDCKMRGLLTTAQRRGIVTIEVTNASGELWDSIKLKGITQETYMNFPFEAGKAVLETIESWHGAVDVGNRGSIITERSIYLVLQWNPKTVEYQLFQYPAKLPDANSLTWSVKSRRLIGRMGKRVLIEWYGLSGGQLKYYPKTHDAIWVSDVFKLEPLPPTLEVGLRNKAKSYFPEAWALTSN
ncbi:MAG: hypothetical protein KC415_03500 [Anaerolineales bacterium]|nr:hypothetical protein [Anaerolineales bacterium]